MRRNIVPHRANRILAALLVLVVIVLAAWRLWPTPTQVYAPTGPGEVYLALGDSLAWGARLERPATQSYPALLHARLGASALAEIELVNLAIPGETSASFVQRQLPQARAVIARERAAGRRVSPITLDIGGNDLRGAERGTPGERAEAIQAVRQNLAHSLDELQRATAGRADIVVMTYYNPYGGDPNQENSEAYWVTQLNAAIRAEAAQRSIAVADTYAPFDGGHAYSYTNILLGDIHATRQGHEVIAAQFWEALGYGRQQGGGT